MEEKIKIKKNKRLRGFPGVVKGLLDPLNSREEFQEEFKDENFTVLLNTNDGKLAALITIQNGNLEIDSIKNIPKENIAKKNAGWGGKLETSTPLFLEIAMGKLSLVGIIFKVITRKIKMRGVRKLLKVLKMFGMLEQG